MKDEYTCELLDHCIAKTYALKNNDKKLPGRTVFEHCLIVGEVARSLIKRFPTFLQFLFPNGSELVAAAHDIGKVSPVFQKRIYENIKAAPKIDLGLEKVSCNLEKNWGYHAGVSQVAIKPCKPGKYIPEILGQHHGYSPNTYEYSANCEVLGGNHWQKCRKKLVDKLKSQLNCDWPKVRSPLHALILAGLTTVSDWIGSSDQFDDPTKDWQSLIEPALDAAGFVRPDLLNNLSFSEIFPFEPNGIQSELIKCCNSPGLYILEAPMGVGKTEAALYAAYKLMVSNNASGIYFALPTQLTSNSIHCRMRLFLKKILKKDNRQVDALLLHGNAWLQRYELEGEGKPGGSWFQYNKRGILAPFATGTIDQALMAVMNVKHGFVRTFGLIGKIVILDEVHSYDAYTGTIIDTLIKALLSLNCTVIVLSATLTNERRSELFINQVLLEHSQKSNNYPLISALPKNQKLYEIPIQFSDTSEVSIKLSCKESESFKEAIYRAEQGQHVLWIENTVDEAQEIFKVLAARSIENLNLSCGLLHSRFLKHDRDNLENLWISSFGRGHKEGKGGCILVGTQVLEQSIDIDADFLISRMCPTDMLLQRLGRLWRHKEKKRPKSAEREAWILAPIWSEVLIDPKKDFGKTSLIYSPYVLYRSLEVWSQIRSISLPNCIRSLIEDTYRERGEIGKINCFKEELQKQKETYRRLASIGLSKGGKTISEVRASTRYSEQDTVEVLLFSSCRFNDVSTTLTLLNGEQIILPKNGKKLKKQEWKNLAIILQSNTVKVAEYLAPTALPVHDLYWLKDYLYLGDYEESLLRIAKVQDNCALDCFLKDYELKYDSKIGYQAKKRK